MAGVNIGKNNSKKISELKPRDIITTHIKGDKYVT